MWTNSETDLIETTDDQNRFSSEEVNGTETSDSYFTKVMDQITYERIVASLVVVVMMSKMIAQALKRLCCRQDESKMPTKLTDEETKTEGNFYYCIIKRE